MGLISAPSLRGLTPESHRPHALHGDDRVWPETNCYVDLWTEVLAALGCDPVAALAFTLATDFDGEQWEFFKHPPEDLRDLYGIEVREINVWRPIEEHVETHLRNGNLITVEVDAWHLPDTTGVSYGIGHQKTTILPGAIDREGRHLAYFHNRGYFALGGDDFDGAMRRGVDGAALAPYTEVVRLDRLSLVPEPELRERARPLVQRYLALRPADNPVRRLAARAVDDVDWLRDQDPEMFHAYAFGTLRQCGSWAESLASFVRWWWQGELEAAAADLDALAAGAKTCQFKLARAATGRSVDLGASFEPVVSSWERAFAAIGSAGG